jgi:hypothetical protein
MKIEHNFIASAKDRENRAQRGIAHDPYGTAHHAPYDFTPSVERN